VKVTKRTVGNIEKGYSIATVPAITVDGMPAFAAGSEVDGPLLFFEPPDYKSTKISDGPGGFISLWPLIHKGCPYIVASVDFKPVFQARNCRIQIYPLDQGPGPAPYEAGPLPYTHRVAVAKVAGKDYLLASTLCESKESKDDWSHPGGIHVAQIPADLSEPLRPRQVVFGLNKNHGMDFARLPSSPNGGFLLSAMEGLFYLHIPDDPEGEWPSEKIADGEHSDAFAYDVEGTGTPQVFAISPFHGTTVKIYRHEQGSWQPSVIADDISFGHVVWAGELLGEPALLVGGRRERRELRLYRKSGLGGKEFSYEIIEEDIGPTQVAVVNRGKDSASLIVAAHNQHEINIYDLTR
jgi:hypothetical protein